MCVLGDVVHLGSLSVWLVVMKILLGSDTDGCVDGCSNAYFRIVHA